MRVLHVWKSESGQWGGGGAVAMHRLHQELRKTGIDSRIICEIKTTESPYVSVLPRKPRLERRLQKITSTLGLNDIHLVSSNALKELEVFRETDVLHIHGMHSGTLSYLSLPALSKSKPTVFTLHDMWSLTGHCAYSYDCKRWKIGCGSCPYPDSYPAVRKDATWLEWRLKRWTYKHSDLTFIAPSKWLLDLSREGLINRFPIHHIPHGINMNIYQPMDKYQCRKQLGIPLNRKVIMCSAVKLNDYRKGGDLLGKILQDLNVSFKGNITLLALGDGGNEITDKTRLPVINLGYINDDHLKAMCYSAADIFAFPTRAEAFGLVLIESIACGTPVISCKVGGVTDIVRPGQTGYLVENEDTDEFAGRIIQLLEDQTLYNSMSTQCREIAVKEYTNDLQNKRHIELYQSLI